MHRLLPFVSLFLLATALTAQAQVQIGVNQAWAGNDYGHDLTKSFSLPAWERIFDEARAANLRSVRVWVFEGMEGVVDDAQGLAAGVDPRLLDNVDRLADLAGARGLTIYWTLHDGNLHGSRIDAQRRLCTNQGGYGDAFRRHVLAPFLARIARRPQLVFAVDLLNEVQGSLKAKPKVWADEWDGARRYLATMASFVHRVAPGLRVAASSGHHSSVSDVLAGRLDGLGLDLIDVHVYSGGSIPSAARLQRHARARGLPLVLGEFGPNPSSFTGKLVKTFGSKLTARYQARVMAAFVREAQRYGFEAAFPWRLEDAEPLFGLVEGGAPRPALQRLSELAGPSPASSPEPRRGLADRVRQ